MIKIGVTENVFIEKQSKNEKGTLEITLTEAGSEKKKLSAIEMMNESSDQSGTGGGTTFMMFMPSREYQSELIAADKMVQNLTKFKNQMHHFLRRFVPESQIKWNPFKGLIIKSDEDLMEKITEENTYKLVYTNIVDQFVEQAEKLKINDPAKKSRVFLIRQSKEKGFGRFRDNYLDSRPFFESMDIPKDKSKMYVKAGTAGATTYYESDPDGYIPNFDPYEIGKGFDNPVMSTTKADAPSNTPEEAAQVEGVFGGPAQTEAIDFSAPPSFGMPDAVSPVPGLTADPSETKEDK